MRALPTKRWVKEHLSAFICCETTPMASLWIRLVVFFCPDCRDEYRSMKRVWDELDDWDVSAPADEAEDQFSQTLRNKYPAAFETSKEPPLTRTGDLVLRLAYTAAIVLLTVAVFRGREDIPREPVSRVVVNNPADSPGAEASLKLQGAEERLASLSAPALEPDTTLRLPQAPPQLRRILAPERKALAPTPHLVAVSLDDAGVQRPMRGGIRPHRTIQINDLPLNGFETLLSQEEDHSY